MSNSLELCTYHFPGWLRWPGGINKDPTVWVDGARPPNKYVFKNNISLTNLYYTQKFDKIGPYKKLYFKNMYDGWISFNV